MNDNLSKGLLKRLCTQIGVGYTKELGQVVSAYHQAKCEESEAKLKVLVDFLKPLADNIATTYDFSGNELNSIAKQALERIGE